MSNSIVRVLVADDNADVREALRLLLKLEGFSPVVVTSPEEVATQLNSTSFDLVLLDLNYARDTTSGQEGLTLLSEIAAQYPTLPVLVMTAWTTIEGAVEAMRRGARDYIAKPWDNARLVELVHRQVAKSKAEQATATATATTPANTSAKPDATPSKQQFDLVAGSPAMQSVMLLVDRVAPSDASVLLTGEHGTGKEVLAKVIHQKSMRVKSAFVAMNAGGFSDGVFESELFGHVKGAFTDAKSDRKGAFEQAHCGTLFLDEIGNMPLSQQGKLLRVLQTGELYRVGSSRVIHVDVRLVAATNVDLNKEVSAGRFREDLLYRINTVEMRLPPLRERKEDIPALVDRALNRWAERRGKTVTISEKAMAALMGHNFPGNVRELEHVIERAVLLAQNNTIEENDLGIRARETATPVQPIDKMTLDEAEKYLIERALQRAAGNVNDAAAELGLSRSAMYRRLQRYGLATGQER